MFQTAILFYMNKIPFLLLLLLLILTCFSFFCSYIEIPIESEIMDGF